MEEFVYHENFRLEDNYWWFVARNKILLSVIKSRTKLNFGDIILDVGSGTGGVAKALSDKYDMICLDTSPIALDYCRKRGLKNLYQGILDDFDSLDKNIKAVTMFDVIEHIEDDNGIVKRVFSILPDNGYLITTVPAYMWLWSQHDAYHMHKRRYNKKQFVKLLKENGFNVEYFTYFNTLLFPFAVISKFLKHFTKYAKNNPVDEVPDLVNKIFKMIFSLEAKLLKLIKFPFGLSILVVAKKAEKS